MRISVTSLHYLQVYCWRCLRWKLIETCFLWKIIPNTTYNKITSNWCCFHQISDLNMIQVIPLRMQWRCWTNRRDNAISLTDFKMAVAGNAYSEGGRRDFYGGGVYFSYDSRFFSAHIPDHVWIIIWVHSTKKLNSPFHNAESKSQDILLFPCSPCNWIMWYPIYPQQPLIFLVASTASPF